jgi:hypothetical protein
MRHRIGFATTCLHISAAIYVGLGLLAPLVVSPGPGGAVGRSVAGVFFIVCMAMAVGIEFVVASLHRRRFWAWVVGLCIFALYASSLFLPLGVLGLWGLLNPGSRAEFGIGVSQKPRTE